MSPKTINYINIALKYAEKYGIIDYVVKGNKMIYNQNYNNKEFRGTWISSPCTYQRTVDLDTMNVTTRKLKRLQKNGWNNV